MRGWCAQVFNVRLVIDFLGSQRFSRADTRLLCWPSGILPLQKQKQSLKTFLVSFVRRRCKRAAVLRSFLIPVPFDEQRSAVRSCLAPKYHACSRSRTARSRDSASFALMILLFACFLLYLSDLVLFFRVVPFVFGRGFSSCFCSCNSGCGEKSSHYAPPTWAQGQVGVPRRVRHARGQVASSNLQRAQAGV